MKMTDNWAIVSNKPISLTITALKQVSELVLSNQNLSTTVYDVVSNFKQTISQVNNGNIKTVFTLNNGITWSTWDTKSNNFVQLTNSITDLTEINSTEWNNFKDEVYEKGMDSATMQTLDFSSLFNTNNHTIRFAHVLIAPTIDDISILQNIIITGDKVGNWHRLSESDVDIAINTNSCSVTSKLENLTNVKVNILI